VPSRVKDEPRDDEAGPSTAPAEAADPKPQLTKRRGGLRTAAQLAEEAAAAAADRSPSPEPDQQTATVHRDQAGRVLDVEQLRAEARREELEEQLKEQEREEWTKGFKQREERERRAKEEASMSSKDVAR
jgi:pre-mRNA-splicing factor CWC26